VFGASRDHEAFPVVLAAFVPTTATFSGAELQLVSVWFFVWLATGFPGALNPSTPKSISVLPDPRSTVM
jgi:hypothetical protein